MAETSSKILTEFYDTLSKVDKEISVILSEHKKYWMEKPVKDSLSANRVQSVIDRVHNDVLQQCSKDAEELKKLFISKTISKRQLRKQLFGIKAQISQLLKEKEGLIQKEYESEMKNSKMNVTSTSRNLGQQSRTIDTIPSTSTQLMLPSTHSLRSIITNNRPLTNILILSDVDMVFSNPPTELSIEEFILERPSLSDSPSLQNVTSAFSLTARNSDSLSWTTSTSTHGTLHTTHSSTDSNRRFH